ncbi:MAG TPA: hypothetical protein VFY04_07670 [Solirubrobacterales bacterium]|nr:hypothetical protein [Solirubrobacterales bacterium]
MGRSTTLACGLVALTFALGAAGCGDDDEGGGTATANGAAAKDSGSASPANDGVSSAKEEFIAAANRACAREWRRLVPRISAYNRRFGSAPREGTPAYTDLAEATFIPTFEAELDAVRALEAPPSEEGRVEALLADHQEAIGRAAEQEVESFDQLQRALAPTSRSLARYGLTRCTASGF